MKLYGKELDAELKKRLAFRTERIRQRKSFRAKAKEMDMTPSEYLHWENGENVCPHEEYKIGIAGVHRPYFLIETCVKCHHPRIMAKIETEEDCDKYKKELTEAFENNKRKP